MWGRLTQLLLRESPIGDLVDVGISPVATKKKEVVESSGCLDNSGGSRGRLPNVCSVQEPNSPRL